VRHAPGDRPNLEAVIARLGEISKGAQKQHEAEDGTEEPETDAPAGRRRGRRRR
jgi:hypothetical protein